MDSWRIVERGRRFSNLVLLNLSRGPNFKSRVFTPSLPSCLHDMLLTSKLSFFDYALCIQTGELEVSVMRIRSTIYLLAFLSVCLTPCFAHHTAVVVNKGNEVDNVTSTHLAKIIRREVKKWPD